MANLQLDNSEVVRAVLVQAALGRDASNMDTATEADVRAIIRSGMRRFFYPSENGLTYQWSFLEDTYAISAEAVYETGTIAVSGGTVTLTGGTWPADVTDHYIRVSNHVLFPTSRDSGTQVTVNHSQLTIAAGTSYEAPRYRYSLPSDFGEFLDGLVYANESKNRMLINSSEPELRLRYAIGYALANETTHYAVFGDKVMLWPTPEPDAYIQGTYLKQPEDNLPADLTTPGSVAQVDGIYAEALLEAILAAAESYNDDTQGLHEARFQSALQSAINHDRAIRGAYDFSTRTNVEFKGVGPVTNIDFSDATS